ncbi:hypothetical protein WGC32_11520 [Zongyangia sp. HA2173]|uniref:hypothetical protein n=1 Tax=Zongyangia sp. HA2173 TaxID=3133035 RepID=UPI00315F5331
MSRLDRAAQFSPFAALTGYDAAIKETARLTDKKVELGEYELEELNRTLLELSDHISQHPQVMVTYFEPDKCKEGGAYITVSKEIKRIDEIEQAIYFTDGSKIPLSDIFSIEISN